MRDGWVEYKFKDVATAVKGKLPKNKNEDGIGIPYLTANFLRSSKPDYWIENIEGAVTAEDGDCLILWDGAGAGDLFSAHRGVVSSTMAVVTTQNSKILREFLTLFISSKAEYIKETCRGTTVPHVSPDAIANMDLKIPPLSEQKRIVDLISSVDSYIEALQQQLESAKKSRNAVLHELLTAGGDDWEYKTLSDICEVRDGTHDSPKPSHEGFALVTSKNIKDGKLDLESAYLISPQDYIEVNKRSKVEQFNLLISMIGTIGEVIVIENKPNFAIKNVGLLKSTEPILSRYLCHYLGSQLGKNAISLSVSGSTQKFISLGKLRGLPVLYPPRENQKAIVEAMSLFDQQISKNLEVATRIKNLRSSMLSDLLSGEHQIPDSYDKVIGAA
jgi:type I restriction enzyme S subunit